MCSCSKKKTNFVTPPSQSTQFITIKCSNCTGNLINSGGTPYPVHATFVKVPITLYEEWLSQGYAFDVQ